MRNTKLFIHMLSTLLLVIVLLGPTSTPAGAETDELKADPRLLQMAEENPDATFMVIVQKDAKNQDLNDTDVEDEVLKGSGQVKKQLDLIVSFSAEMTGKEILKLAKHPKVRWISADAIMVSTGTPGLENIRDDFATQGYNGSSGANAWSSNWLETGEQTSATAGLIQVVANTACAGAGGYCLRVDPYTPAGNYVYRQANLSGFVSVWLSLYRNNLLNLLSGTSEQVQLQVSANGGASWTTLRTYSSTAYTGIATESFDISAYASANTQIRFLISQQQSGIRYIYFDNIEIEFARPSSFVSATRADQLNMNGSGITVAVVDSGITSSHPDLITNNTSRVIAGAKFGNNLTVEDTYGHGTHVAGIIGGNGSTSAGKYRGMAPNVNLINIKTSDGNGMTYESSVVDGLQWIYNNRSTYNIRVVNISMNSTVAQSYHTSPLDAAAEILWFNGIVVIVSAGNNGTGAGPVTLYPPANDPFVITVGATEDKGTAGLGDDTLAAFSAYGTTEDGFAKPDIVAPGRNVVAPLGGLLSTVFQAYPLHRVNEFYFRMSGTSMSAPIVSGAVALLLQDQPGLNPDQVKYRLKNTASTAWAGYNSIQSGAGYLDAYAAVSGRSTKTANTGIVVSNMLMSGSSPVTWGSVGWNSVGWNSVGWNSVGWNSVGWNSVGWNTSLWDQ